MAERMEMEESFAEKVRLLIVTLARARFVGRRGLSRIES